MFDFSSQHDPEVIVKVIDSLRLLLYDDNVLVQKKLIVSMITIYRLTLKVNIYWLNLDSNQILQNVNKKKQTRSGFQEI